MSSTHTLTGTRTEVIEQTVQLQQQTTSRGVRFTDDTIDNENMNKKSSKCCCIYVKPKSGEETSSESSSSSDEDINAYERQKRRKKKHLRKYEKNEINKSEETENKNKMKHK